MAMLLFLPVCLCIAAAHLQLDEAFYGDPSQVLESAQHRGSDLTIEEAQEISNFVKQYGVDAFRNLSLSSGASFDWNKFAGGISKTREWKDFKAWDAGFGLVGGGIQVINDLTDDKSWTTVVYDVGQMSLPFLAPVLAGINPFLGAAFSIGLAVFGSIGGRTSDSFTKTIHQMHDEIMAETKNYVTETLADRDINILAGTVGMLTQKLQDDVHWRCNEFDKNATVRRSCEDSKIQFSSYLNGQFENDLKYGAVFSLSCTQYDIQNERFSPIPFPRDETCAKFQGHPYTFQNQSAWARLYLANLIELYRFEPTRSGRKQELEKKRIMLQELLLDSAQGFAFQHDRIENQKWPAPWYDENTFQGCGGFFKPCHKCWLIASETDLPKDGWDWDDPPPADVDKVRQHFTAPVAGWCLLDSLSLVYGPGASCDWKNPDTHNSGTCNKGRIECQGYDSNQPSTYKNGLGMCCQEPFRQLHYLWQSLALASRSTSVFQGVLTEGSLNLGSQSPSIGDQVFQPLGMSWVGSGTQLAVSCCNPGSSFCMTRITSPVYFSSVTPTTNASRIWSWHEQQPQNAVAMSAVPFTPWIAYVRRENGEGFYNLQFFDFHGALFVQQRFDWANGVEVSPDGNFIALLFNFTVPSWEEVPPLAPFKVTILRSKDLSVLPQKNGPSSYTELNVSAFAWRKDSQGYAMYTRTNGLRWYNISGSEEDSTCVFVPTDAPELSPLIDWPVNGLHFNSDGSVVALRRLGSQNGIYFVKYTFDETGQGAGKVLPARILGSFQSADWGEDGHGNPDGRLVTGGPGGVAFWRLKSNYSAVEMGKRVSYKSGVKQVALMSGAGAIVLPHNGNAQTGLCSVESLTP